jgi:AbrB family looped-hinge helix DNA binding protein
VGKVTSKLQVTVPKAVADRVGIRPGDDLEWIVEGRSIRLRRVRDDRRWSVADRLNLFDESTARQRARNRAWRRQHGATRPGADRGWTRREIYTRGRAR